jgi:phage/conjugal plasmid C-4 type zinc finger TraR family protein
MDFIDNAQDREQLIADNRINQRVRFVGTSAYECETCGEPIPEKRRTALAGRTTCVYCKELEERRG